MRLKSARGLFDRTRAPGSEAAANELAVRLGQQQAVAHLGQSALTDVSLQTVFDEACVAVATCLEADVAAVLELDPDGQTFTTRATVGWLPEEYAGTGIPAGASHSGYTLTSNHPVILRDAETEARFTLSPMMLAKGLRSGLITKIGRNGTTYGVIGAHTFLQRDFSEHDVTFLEAVANILSSAIRRQAAETAADEALRVLEAVIEGTTDVVFINDRDGRFVAVNQRAAVKLGLPREEIIGRTLHEVFPPDVAEAIAETDRRALEDGTVETFEEHIRLGDEEQVYLTTKGPYRARDGAVLGTFGIARDITERAKRAEELARSEQRFRLAQEGARMGTWDVDLVSGVTTWSTGLHSDLRHRPGEPDGLTHFSRLLHPDDVEPITRIFMDSYRTGADVETECRIIRPDGALRWLSRCGRPHCEATTAHPCACSASLPTSQSASSPKSELAAQRGDAPARADGRAARRLGLESRNGRAPTGPTALYEIFELPPDSYRPSGKSLAEHIHPGRPRPGRCGLSGGACLRVTPVRIPRPHRAPLRRGALGREPRCDLPRRRRASQSASSASRSTTPTAPGMRTSARRWSSGCGRRRSWRRSAGSRSASRTISTICSLRSGATASSPFARSSAATTQPPGTSPPSSPRANERRH